MAKDELRLVVALNRHGVRAPGRSMNSVEPTSPDAYASESWPAWPVGFDLLTPRGQELARLLGAYWRDYYVTSGRLGLGDDCRSISEVHARVHNVRRDIETADGFYAGLFPGCVVPRDVRPPGTVDTLFRPVPSLCTITPEEATASILEQLDGIVPNIQQEFAEPFAMLQEVLDCCSPVACGEPAPDRCALVDLPSGITPEGSIYGAFRVGKTATETFLLQFAQGMPAADVGWGRANEETIQQMIEIHLRFQAVNDRAEPWSVRQGSNLAAHILGSMQQAVTGTAVPGISQSVETRLVNYIGHDDNIQNVTGLLGMTWHNPEYQPNQTPPGGAVLFELWRRARDGGYFVRGRYLTQTLGQMANSTPLSLDVPPSWSPVRIAGCGDDNPPHYDCPYPSFRELVEKALDPACVSPSLTAP